MEDQRISTETGVILKGITQGDPYKIWMNWFNNILCFFICDFGETKFWVMIWWD